MFKKIVTSLFITLWLSSVVLVGYRMYEPKPATIVSNDPIVNDSTDQALLSANIQNQSNKNLSIDQIAEDVLLGSVPTPDSTSVEMHYYFFCTVDNVDCQYVRENVLPPLVSTLQVEKIEIIEYVDLTQSTEWTPARLMEQWGVETFPAFVTIKTTGGTQKEVLSVLKWKSEDPIDSSDLKRWMIDNNIWTGPVENTGELIEQPVGQ